MSFYDELREISERHLDNQPYEATCEGCGKDMKPEIDTSVDRDGDLIIKIPPCETCLDQAKEEGRAEAKEAANE